MAHEKLSHQFLIFLIASNDLSHISLQKAVSTFKLSSNCSEIMKTAKQERVKHNEMFDYYDQTQTKTRLRPAVLSHLASLSPVTSSQS